MIALDLGNAIQHPNRPPPPLLTTPPGYTLRARTNISSWDLELLGCQLELIDCQLQKQESEPAALQSPQSSSRMLQNGHIPAPVNHARSLPDPALQRQLQLRMGRPLGRDNTNEQRRLRRDDLIEQPQRHLDRDGPNGSLVREDALTPSLLTDPRLNRHDQLHPSGSSRANEPPPRDEPSEVVMELEIGERPFFFFGES